MARIKKYKHYTKLKDIRLIPVRLLKFKRSKWIKIKAQLLRKFQTNDKTYLNRINLLEYRAPLFSLDGNSNLKSKHYRNKGRNKSRLKFINKFKTIVNKGRFSYLASYSKDLNQNRLKLNKIFNKTVALDRLKHKERRLFVKQVYKNFFELDGILKALYFFSGSREIKNIFKRKEIYQNEKKLQKINCPNEGDFFRIQSKDINIENNINRVFLNYSQLSNIEIDVYSQQLVVLKSQKELSEKDYSFISLEYINVSKL